MIYMELARQLAEIDMKVMKNSEYKRMTDTIRGEGVLLSYLVCHNNMATPSELSEALDVSTARIAVLLNKMEKKGLLERQRHPDNKRNTIVKLLPKGEKLHKENEETFNLYVMGFFEHIGKEKAQLFVQLQGELAEYMMTKRQMEENTNE